MIIVAAVGGNALLRRGQPLDAATQARNAMSAAEALASLAQEHELVVTHGNGPQVGLLLLETGSAGIAGAYPVDIVGAESQGMIGYLLEVAFRNALPAREIATILGQVTVDPGDPGFVHPSKPIGPFYEASDVDALRRSHQWQFAEIDGKFRRVVPSPEPKEILELGAIRALLRAGVLVISSGGGGVPMVRGKDGRLSGVEAVVDKDLAASLLAIALAADALLLLTDVAAVHEDWGAVVSRTIRAAAPPALRSIEFAEGSMRPKVEAACRFAETTGKLAAIGALEAASEIVAGRSGTAVVRGIEGIQYWEPRT